MVAPFGGSWSRAIRFVFSLGCALLLIGLLNFGSELPASSHPADNSPPTVFFTGAPAEGEVVPYRIEISWSGIDPDLGDGLHHYEFAIDPPTVFTPGEIAHPETSPGVTVTIRPGPGAGRDTVLVSKIVEGTEYSFSWIGTPDTSGVFVFETPVWQYSMVGGVLIPTAYVGEHRFLIRGQDTQGAFSEPASVLFTALNHPPTSTIVYPAISQDILNLGPSATVVAAGTDAEPFSPSGRPIGYLTKVLRLDTLDPPMNILFAVPELLFLGGNSTWSYRQGDTLHTTFPLDVPGQYLFGVRAVDEAAGAETLLAFGRNAFKFQAFADGGTPQLTLREAMTGVFTFVGSGAPQEAEVPAGGKLRFTWSATAEMYGGVIDAYSWGLDIPDTNEGGPDSGWSAWGPSTSTDTPIVFPGSGVHTFRVRVRDVLGTVTTGTLVLIVIEMPFDREVLVVDDSFDDAYPMDSEQDLFWRGLVSYYAAHSDLPEEQFFDWSVFGADDRGTLDPSVPSLSELGRYKLLVWECRGPGYDGKTALVRASALTHLLSAYLGGGGRLWLGGRLTVAATTVDYSGTHANLVYPKTELGPGDFAYDLLKIHSTRVINDLGVHPENMLNRAKVYPGFSMVYDSLMVDLTKLNVSQRSAGGVAGADAIANPILAESEPDFRGNIDSVYVYGASGNEVRGVSSSFHNKLCALRWSDLDPDREHGKIQWFGFSLYFMKTAQAERVFKQSIDWFRVDDLTVAVPLLAFEAVRSEETAVVRWEVPEGQEAAVFHVYREVAGKERERLSLQALSGRTRYEFVDDTPPSGPVAYWLAELGRTGTLSWHGPARLASVPAERGLALAPIQPNPVFGEAQIAYTLPAAGRVVLTIHDVVGRRVAPVVDQVQESGKHSETWRPQGNGGSPLATGFYLIRLQAGGAERVQKVLVLR